MAFMATIQYETGVLLLYAFVHQRSAGYYVTYQKQSCTFSLSFVFTLIAKLLDRRCRNDDVIPAVLKPTPAPIPQPTVMRQSEVDKLKHFFAHSPLSSLFV